LVKALKICRADEQSNKQLKAMNGENEVHTIKKQTAWKAGKDQYTRQTASVRISRSVTTSNKNLNAKIVGSLMHRSSAQRTGKHVSTVERIIIFLKSVERRGKYVSLNKIKVKKIWSLCSSER
jgi:hypothetical protein